MKQAIFAAFALVGATAAPLSQPVPAIPAATKCHQPLPGASDRPSAEIISWCENNCIADIVLQRANCKAHCMEVACAKSNVKIAANGDIPDDRNLRVHQNSDHNFREEILDSRYLRGGSMQDQQRHLNIQPGKSCNLWKTGQCTSGYCCGGGFLGPICEAC